MTSWETTTLGSLARYINGRGFKKSEWRESGIPIIRIQNLTGSTDKINYFDGKLEDGHHIHKGDLLLSWAATLDVYEFTQDEGALNQHIFKVIPNPSVNQKFLYYLLKNKLADLYAQTHGSGMVHITAGKFKSTPAALPSLPEQEKIVAKIEELFSEIASGLQTIAASKTALTSYQQSLLNSLFSGKETTTIGSLVSEVRYGTSKKCTYDQSLTPVLRIPNIVKGLIDTSDLKYASFDKSEIEKLALKNGDLLVIRSNGSPSIVGKCAEVTEKDQGLLYAGYLIRLRFDPDNHNARFYKYLLSSPKLREQIEFKAKSTSGVNNINAEELKSLVVPKLSLEEQNKIVNILDEKGSEIESLRSVIVETTKRMNNLKQSVLSKAFKGELI